MYLCIYVSMHMGGVEIGGIEIGKGWDREIQEQGERLEVHTQHYIHNKNNNVNIR